MAYDDDEIGVGLGQMVNFLVFAGGVIITGTEELNIQYLSVRDYLVSLLNHVKDIDKEEGNQ